MNFSRALPLAALSLVAVCMTRPALAATLCVNHSGAHHCYSKITDAVSDASAGDTIRVAHGVYPEYVKITKSLSLVGENKQNTIVEAAGQPFGIYVDGYDNTGLSGVVISGFTVEDADNAGIAVSNASNVTISDNRVQYNDRALDFPNCPTLGMDSDFPQFTGEAFDCGEGIFFSGVDHSTLAHNIVTHNAGGMLITDDTGATHDNLITGNSVVRNTNPDCGITLPSHLGMSMGGGVFNNTVSDNDSSYNGGPGVGIFAPGPDSRASGNVVINNTLRGNGLPGVTMHNHAAAGVGPVPPNAPPVNFNDNVIVGNRISENAADTEDAETSGPTGINIFSVAPVTGTVISQNVIREEQLDIAVRVLSDVGVPAALIHLNNFPQHDVGVENAGAAQVDATQNWWGCSRGPGAHGCATTSISGTGTILVAPWLSRPFYAEGRDYRHGDY